MWVYTASEVKTRRAAFKRALELNEAEAHGSSNKKKQNAGNEVKFMQALVKNAERDQLIDKKLAVSYREAIIELLQDMQECGKNEESFFKLLYSSLLSINLNSETVKPDFVKSVQSVFKVKNRN